MGVTVTGMSISISFLAFMVALCSSSDERKTYVVYMGDIPSSFKSTMHHELLASVTGSHQIARESMVYSYNRSFNAFAAKLLPEEAKKLAETEGVVSVFPNRKHKLHTTRSWDYVGFPINVNRNLKLENDIIVGMLDSGITPTSSSFNDKGLGPPPSKFKGKCEKSKHFKGCNKKLIGARYYRSEGPAYHPDILSVVDTMGHGTHTASTATGVLVGNTSLYGLAAGTVRGGVPGARLAAYKICWTDGCWDTDILAAFDDAIADGVDVISISVGGPIVDYFLDCITIGSFHAMKNGVLTMGSAGNDGPSRGIVENGAPWMLTVGATTMDRQFRTKLGLGNGKQTIGRSLNMFSSQKKFFPLITGAQAASNSSDAFFNDPVACIPESLDPNKIKGKIVFCIPMADGIDADLKDMGAAGVIMQSDDKPDTAFPYVLPAIDFDSNISTILYRYINTSRSPRAVIDKTHTIYASIPMAASFSSRGPTLLSKKLLKPDIAAPGVNILAAFSPLISITGNYNDPRFVNYNLMSGTSMACPHLTAAAAYVKSFHPDWSPAAIRSALMTTARRLNPRANPDAELAYGSGLFNPKSALYPGLVYDMNELGYIQFLCKEGVNGTTLKALTNGQYRDCRSVPPVNSYDGLNYPSMQISVEHGNQQINALFERTVTNVGPANSVYRAKVSAPSGLRIIVSPHTLSFGAKAKRLSFKVLVKGRPLGVKDMVSASLVWDDSRHKVRSPILVFRQNSIVD